MVNQAKLDFLTVIDSPYANILLFPEDFGVGVEDRRGLANQSIDYRVELLTSYRFIIPLIAQSIWGIDPRMLFSVALNEIHEMF